MNLDQIDLIAQFAGVSPMVQFAKSVALNIDDQAAVSGWRRQNQSVSLKCTNTQTHKYTNTQEAESVGESHAVMQ